MSKVEVKYHKRGCGQCKICRAQKPWIDNEFKEVIVYGLGTETVRYFQYMARQTML